MARLTKPEAGTTYVAVLEKRGKVFEAHTAFGDQEDVFIGRKSLREARDGDLVIVRSDGRGRGEVLKRLGNSQALPVIMEAIIAHYRVPRGFSRAAAEEAETQAERATDPDDDRQDLTGLYSFTIDPDEAQDYDDAISLEDGPAADELTLWVHIADVSYYVAEGSRLDAEARNKACSVYLPIAVEPMLPRVLSNDVCSLRPDVERKCLTVEMIFDRREAEEETVAGQERENTRNGRRGKHEKHKAESAAAAGAPVPAAGNGKQLLPKKVRFYRSTIRSSRRLTYNEVDDLFEGVEGTENAPPGMLRERRDDGQGEEQRRDERQIIERLERCRLFAGRLRAARHARGALNIQTYEPEFRLNSDGEVVGVRARPESESHALIEEFMIAANEAVARFLERRDSTCIYRIHEEPDAHKVDSLFDILEDLGVPTPPFSLTKGSPQAAGEAIRKMLLSLPTVLSERQKQSSVFGEIVLRSLKQAIYLEDNLGHFGLASPAYLHFTSPIRRYPDLVVHRALLHELGKDGLTCDRLQIADIAKNSSENERRAALVERTGDDVVLAHLLDRTLFEEGWDRVFEGQIVSVISSGLFVRFEKNYEGFVPARKLWGDYFAISEKGSALIGRRKGRPFRLGDDMRVRVVRIDKLRGKVELEPAK